MAAWAQLGVHCSSNERRADEASRDVEAWLKCYYMRDHLGQEYAGTITGANASNTISITIWFNQAEFNSARIQINSADQNMYSIS